MTRLTNTLGRLGAAQLAAFLGDDTVRLLEVLDLKNLAPAALADLVVKQVGPEALLLNKSSRSEIVAALRREDAQQLVSLLGLTSGQDPWAGIERVAFSRGKPATEVLFSFFGYPFLEDAKQIELEQPTQALVPPYCLFEHQRRAYQEVIDLLERGPRPRVLLHMPTGAGKTRTAMNVIGRFLRDRFKIGEVVVWLAHTEELCDQAAEELVEAWRAIGNRSVTLFRAYGPYRVDLEAVRDGVLIGGIQLLYQRSLTEQQAFLKLAGRTRLVVMDEAHQAIAPTYEHVLNLLAANPSTGVLGLSATPGRSLLDAGEDLRLAQFFRRQKVTLSVPGYENPVEFLQKEGYLAQVEYSYINFAPTYLTLTPQEQEELRLGFDLPDSVIARLGRDHMRNLLVLNRIMKEADERGKIIAFACSVPHANLLANLLRLRGYTAASVTSSTPPATRRQLIAQYRDTDNLQILTNFGVLTMGFDAPRTNVAMIARPTRSVVLYSQMVGRAARGPRAGGNERCRVITVVDRIPGFRSIAEAFTFWEDIWT